MNYRSHFKKSSGKIFLPEGVDTEQLKKGIRTEKEHTQDVGIAAKIALDHLKEDPKYYDKLSQAGLEEDHENTGWEADAEIGKMQDDPSHRPFPFDKDHTPPMRHGDEKGVLPAKDEHCGVCDDDIDENGGLPKVGGALALPHVGQPIHMAKIISVGATGLHRHDGQTASGDLSGYTSMNKGVTKDAGGIPATSEGDKEPITAGGHEVSNDIVTKSVGGEVVPGKGQTQGGPNTKGTIANTAKLNEGKQRIRKLVKEVLKEIKFDKASGKWVRITENTVDMKMGPSYKVANRQYRTAEDDQARTVQYDPEITEMCDEEEIAMRESRLAELATAARSLTEDELMELNTLARKMEESSYKVASPTQARVSDDDHARTVQTEPEMTEDADFGDEDPFGDAGGEAGDAGACPHCGNTRDNTAMGRTAQCSRCGEDYEIEQDVNPEAELHAFEPEMSDTQLGKIAKIDVSPEPELGVDEAVGGVAQHRSYRTVEDLPQTKDARWSDEIDEAADAKKEPKESDTVKAIKKGQKPKKSLKPDQLKHQIPRTAKSGVHKKDK